jgi:hypothetical protein
MGCMPREQIPNLNLHYQSQPLRITRYGNSPNRLALEGKAMHLHALGPVDHPSPAHYLVSPALAPYLHSKHALMSPRRCCYLVPCRGTGWDCCRP